MLIIRSVISEVVVVGGLHHADSSDLGILFEVATIVPNCRPHCSPGPDSAVSVTRTRFVSLSRRPPQVINSQWADDRLQTLTTMEPHREGLRISVPIGPSA